MLTYGIRIVCTKNRVYASGREAALFVCLALDERAAGCEPLEAGKRPLPVREQRERATRTGETGVPVEELHETLVLVGLERDERHEVVVDEPLVRVEEKRLAAGHPGAEVATVRAEDDDRAAGHVLAPVVADALNDRKCARVAHGEPLAGRAGAEELAAGRAVEHGIAEEARIADVARRGRDDDTAAGHRLPDVVVRLADEPEVDAGREERAEALARRALESRPHAAGGGGRAHGLRDRAAQAGADRPIGVRHLVRGLHEPRAADRGLALGKEERPEPIALVRDRLSDVPGMSLAGRDEERAEVERVGRRIARPPLAKEVDAADRLVEGPEA